MNATESLDDLGHSQIRDWLERALRGREPLPRLTPDEAAHLGIVRLEKSLKPATSDFLRDGCVQLVRRFCENGEGEPDYLDELIALAVAFKAPESLALLAKLALRFSQLPKITDQVHFAVLAALVDALPPRQPEFWHRIFTEAPERYGTMALSGILAINPFEAVGLLPKFPDDERMGQAAALKLDLAWDELKPAQRFELVDQVQKVLWRCGAKFANPIETWAKSKGAARFFVVNSTLLSAISGALGSDAEPKHFNSRLLAEAA